MGAHLNTYTSREMTTYYAKVRLMAHTRALGPTSFLRCGGARHCHSLL